MDTHQVSLTPRGGATGDRRPGAGRRRRINTARAPPSARDPARADPSAPERPRARAAHDKCHRDTAQQPSGSPENREKRVKSASHPVV